MCAVSVRTHLHFLEYRCCCCYKTIVCSSLYLQHICTFPFAIFSRLSHTHPHLVVAVHVDKRRVIAGPHDAIVLIFNGSHTVVEQGLLELVLVLLKVPE